MFGSLACSAKFHTFKQFPNSYFAISSIEINNHYPGFSRVATRMIFLDEDEALETLKDPTLEVKADLGLGRADFVVAEELQKGHPKRRIGKARWWKVDHSGVLPELIELKDMPYEVAKENEGRARWAAIG